MLVDVPVEEFWPQDLDIVTAGTFTAARDGAMGRLNAAAAELVGVVQRCIRENWWRAWECHSPEHWLEATAGVDGPRARRLVRIARGLVDWPELGAAFGRGQLTEAHVDIVVSDCWHAFDAQLAPAAGQWNIAQLHRMKRVFARPPDPTPEPCAGDAGDAGGGEDDVAARGPVDSFGSGWDDDGRFRGRFDLGPELGALAAKAFAAARNAVYRDRTGSDPDREGAPVDTIRPVDTFERLLHAGLAGLDPAVARGQRPSDRYQALIHLDAAHPERSRIHLGGLLSDQDRRYLTCDADIRLIWWLDGRPVKRGRRQRVADPVLRALIEDRDHGCRVCGAARFLHIHHLVAWEDGGPTDPENLIAVCTRCHRQIHRGHIRLAGDPTTPDGLALVDRHGRPLARPGPLEPDGPPDGAEPYAPIRGSIMYSMVGYAVPPPEHRAQYPHEYN